MSGLQSHISPGRQEEGVGHLQELIEGVLSAPGGNLWTDCGLRLGRLAFLLFHKALCCPQDED